MVSGVLAEANSLHPAAVLKTNEQRLGSELQHSGGVGPPPGAVLEAYGAG